ncbi:unnamed protein product [Prorocentrum cordatum]|uniref:ABC transporter domain-containing protein n=1 Tax=Prorocentrum cordatum TaxID=2364126 RepID=A0ABN9RCJ6_9DINO|nr:unnamed protein product [Polarella glacialis]
MELIERLMELQALGDQYKVDQVEPRLRGVLAKCGFLDSDLDLKVGNFSGGWKVRMGLAKIFMNSPDVLLLDEPTNHLDLESVEWLETFLINQDIPVVVVSHDREFMDRVCNKIVDTAEGMTYSYKGNYTQFLEQREEKMRIWKAKFRQQCKEVSAIEKYIKVNKGKQAMSQAVARRTRELETRRKSKDWMDPPPRLLKRIKFFFPEPPVQQRGSRKSVTLAALNNTTHGYGDGIDKVLFDGATMTVDYGDKIGIVGANGAGKSTLLRLLLGKEEPISGSQSSEGRKPWRFRLYPTAYKPGTVVLREGLADFTQHQADLLPQDLTTLEAVEQSNGMGMAQKDFRGQQSLHARSTSIWRIAVANVDAACGKQHGEEAAGGLADLIEIMSKFRFKGKRLDVKVGACSGGEKARLAIVRMMLTPSQLLVLDEPTNHLDVTMKETLEYSLREFPGAAVIVSHDRYFLSQTCRKILEVKNGKVRIHDGDFRSYMESDRELRKKIERRYSGASAGILPVPMSGEEAKAESRGGLKKYAYKRRIAAQIAARNQPVILSR